MTQPNATPFVPGPYKTVAAIFATANTDQSGASGTVATVYSPASAGQGSYIRDVDVVVPGTSSAAVVVVLVNDGTSTVAAVPISISAVTPNASLACFRTRVTLDLYVPAGGALKVLTTVAQSTHARFTVADY